MKRRLLLVAPLVVALLILLPSLTLAADPPETRGVLLGVREDVTLPAGHDADAIIVIGSTATVEGQARTLVVIDGQAVLAGPDASAEVIVAIGGSVTVGPGAEVGTIRHVRAEVTVDPAATVTDTVSSVEGDLLWVAGALAVFALALWVGAGLATLAAGLVLAGLATDQVRRTGALISREPWKVLGAGLLAMLVPPVVAAIVMATVVGIPLGLGLLLAWGAVAFGGYLVTGIWLGERILASGRAERPGGRPYGAALLGLLIVLIAGFIPLVTMLVGWVGLGAVTLAGWRVFRAPPIVTQPAPPPWSASPPR